MNAHIITVGDEILIGQVLNTNAAYIGKELIENNINVVSTSVIGDNEAEIVQEFKKAYEENDLVIVTGGLVRRMMMLPASALSTFLILSLYKIQKYLKISKTYLKNADGK